MVKLLLAKIMGWLARKDLFRIRCHVNNQGKIRIKKTVDGKGNELIVGRNSVLNDVKILIIGNKNTILIGDNCYLGEKCIIRVEGNNITVTIGNRCSFTHDDILCAQEDNVEIRIGEDCMFSHHITVRTSDSHLIYDTETNKRINPPRSVVIDDHVWVSPNSIIMKGACIGKGSVVGSNSIVTKVIPSESLAVGIPAKVVKHNVSWSRERVF